MKSVAGFLAKLDCFDLSPGSDRVFYANNGEAVSYPEEGNEACFQIEDQSFLFRHRNDCIRELVRANFHQTGRARFLMWVAEMGF